MGRGDGRLEGGRHTTERPLSGGGQREGTIGPDGPVLAADPEGNGLATTAGEAS